MFNKNLITSMVKRAGGEFGLPWPGASGGPEEGTEIFRFGENPNTMLCQLAANLYCKDLAYKKVWPTCTPPIPRKTRGDHLPTALFNRAKNDIFTSRYNYVIMLMQIIMYEGGKGKGEYEPFI